MERSQLNNNNFITIYSNKYLQARKTSETYLQILISKPNYIYPKTMYPIYRY